MRALDADRRATFDELSVAMWRVHSAPFMDTRWRRWPWHDGPFCIRSELIGEPTGKLETDRSLPCFTVTEWTGVMLKQQLERHGSNRSEG
jgi:hypothetical protein